MKITKEGIYYSKMVFEMLMSAIKIFLFWNVGPIKIAKKRKFSSKMIFGLHMQPSKNPFLGIQVPSNFLFW